MRDLKYLLSMFETIDAVGRRADKDMSDPEVRRQLYKETLDTLQSYFLAEPDGDIIAIWGIYVSKGIEGVRDALSSGDSAPTM